MRKSLCVTRSDAKKIDDLEKNNLREDEKGII